MLAMSWAIGGVVVGFFGLRALRPFSSPLLAWYRSWNEDEERNIRMFMLATEGKTDTEEFKRCLAEEAFAMYLAIPPIFGLFHGVLLGSIGGALCALDSNWGVSASATALFGMLIGPVLVMLVAGMTLAFLIDLDKRLSLHARLARRGLLVISPLLFVPAAWHCLKSVVRRSSLV